MKFTNKYNNFEDFLGDKFLEQRPQVSKDHYEGAFDTWLSQLDNQELIDFADTYKSEETIHLLEQITKAL